MGYVNLPASLQLIFQNLSDRVLKLEMSNRFTAPNVATDPANPRKGDIWLNTTVNQIRYLDATGATKNVPQGLVQQVSSVDNTITANVLVGLTTSFTFVSGRKYKISTSMNILWSSGRAIGTLNAGTLLSQRIFDVSSGTYSNPNGYLIVVGNGTTQNITVSISIVSGVTTFVADSLSSNFHQLTIEDLG